MFQGSLKVYNTHHRNFGIGISIMVNKTNEIQKIEPNLMKTK